MSLLDLLFPPVCVHCSRMGSWLCARCNEDLLPLRNLHPPGLQTYPGIQEILSGYVYEGPSESLVKSVKYEFVSAAVPTMARLIDLQLGKQAAHWNIEYLVPVPLHPKRRAWRGFNQAELLCKELGKLWNVSGAALVERTVQRTSQAGSSKQQRHALTHDFQLTSTLGHDRRLVLIDDVVTTGGTLSACARELEKSAPEWIRAITFAAA